MRKTVYKVGISGVPIENKNLGVMALAYSTLFFLNDLFREEGVETEMTLINSKGKKTDKIVINGTEIAFTNVSFNNPFSLKGLLKCLIFGNIPFFNGISKLNTVMHVVAGDSFSDIYGEKRFCQNLNIIKFFHVLRKRQLLLPQTIGPFKSKKNEKKAFAVLKHMSVVISRDKQSFDYTAKFLSQEKIVEAIDMAFYLYYEAKKFTNNKTNIGINISGLLWNGGYTGNNQFNLKVDYQRLVIDIIRFFSSRENTQIHLIPHVIPDNKPVEDDYSVSEQLKVMFPDMFLPARFKSPIEAKSYISGLDFFVGARMHSCIAAFSSGVPIFPIAYSRKFSGLFYETLQYNWFGDCVHESEESILANLSRAFDKRALLKTQIDIANNTIVKQRFELLKTTLSNNLNDVWKTLDH